MQHFLAAVRKAVDDRNWYGALFLALALPDVCAAIETPDEDAGKRYKRWVRENLEFKYGGQLTADDLYAVREASLHKRLSELERRAIERIHLVLPTAGYDVHRRVVHHALHLQIDSFCLEICQTVEEWTKAVRLNKEMNKRMTSLIRIRRSSGVAPIML